MFDQFNLGNTSYTPLYRPHPYTPLYRNPPSRRKITVNRKGSLRSTRPVQRQLYTIHAEAKATRDLKLQIFGRSNANIDQSGARADGPLCPVHGQHHGRRCRKYGCQGVFVC